MVLPGPALKEGAVHDQLGCGIEVPYGRDVLLEYLGDQGRIGGEGSGSGGLRDSASSS